MKKKSTWILLAVLLAIGVGVYLLANRPIEVGSVEVISGEQSITPLSKQTFVYSQGISEDSTRLQPDEVASALESIPYSDSFYVKISGTTTGTNAYTVYDENFDPVSYRTSTFTTPPSPGTYVVSLDVSWGDEYTATGMQYLFKVIVP